MARVPRALKVHPNYSVHKVWRGHNREWNLGSNFDKTNYLQFLNEDLNSEKYESGAELQALTLMSNHAHEIFLLLDPVHFSNHMRRHHSRYGAHFNRLNNRCGKVAQDRPHTTLLADDYHEMQAVFYVHANPVRAKIVGDARDYFWSTHRLYAFGKREEWMKNIKLPPWYVRLGKTAEQRQKAYRKLYAKYLRDHGSDKKRFLKRYFFGPALWQARLEQRVAEWRRQNIDPP